MSWSLTIVSKNRPLCICPTIAPYQGLSKVRGVSPSCTVRDLKVIIQEQLHRNSVVNHKLLAPERQSLCDPLEGYDLRDDMKLKDTNVVNEATLWLKLSGTLPTSGPQRKWFGSFQREHSLTVPRHDSMSTQNRKIRSVAMSISIRRTGGTPHLATSFAADETAALETRVISQISRMPVGERAEEARTLSTTRGASLTSSSFLS